MIFNDINMPILTSTEPRNRTKMIEMIWCVAPFSSMLKVLSYRCEIKSAFDASRKYISIIIDFSTSIEKLLNRVFRGFF